MKSFEEKNDAVLKLFSDAIKYSAAGDVLLEAFDHVSLDGFHLEMGVFTGGTINFIAHHNPDKKIYGFDSFEGSPEDWERDDTDIFKRGVFATDYIPEVASNVIIKEGLFHDSLPEFKKEILKDAPIAFLHIDCDLYASTKTVFDILSDNLVSGTVIVFDELYNYPGFDKHEIKAFTEFLDEKKMLVKFLAYNSEHEQVAVKLKGV
jgi:hypothetical protein